MSQECEYCGAPYHASADCPGQFQRRMVVALERIVELLEKPVEPVAAKNRGGRPRKAVQP